MNKTQGKQNIHFFTGKGGVGKSVLAASKAMSLAASGKSVLLVELEGAASLKRMLDKKTIQFEYAYLKPLEELKALFTYFFKVKKVTDLFFNNKAMKSLVEAAPGLKELASLGKITSYNRGFGPSYNYDHIVVDGYSTGHFINWLSVPEGLSEVIKLGPMGEQCRGMVESLRDSDTVKYYVVINPEKSPAKEGLELSQSIKAITKIEPVIILNKFVVDKPGQQSKSEYVKMQIKRSARLQDQLKGQNILLAPFSFKKEAYQQSLELSGQWQQA